MGTKTKPGNSNVDPDPSLDNDGNTDSSNPPNHESAHPPTEPPTHPSSGSFRNCRTRPTSSSFGMHPLALSAPLPMFEWYATLLPWKLDQRRATTAMFARWDSSTKPRTRHITSLGSSESCLDPVSMVTTYLYRCFASYSGAYLTNRGGDIVPTGAAGAESRKFYFVNELRTHMVKTKRLFESGFQF